MSAASKHWPHLSHRSYLLGVHLPARRALWVPQPPPLSNPTIVSHRHTYSLRVRIVVLIHGSATVSGQRPMNVVAEGALRHPLTLLVTETSIAP